MYGQKAQFGLVSAGVTAVSWWMFGVTIVLCAIAVILMARVFVTLASKDASRRP